MILDSNALSAWWKGTPGLIFHLEKATDLHLPVPVLAEFRFGILKSTLRPRMEAWLEEAKRLTVVLPADVETAEYYAQTRLKLEAKGRKIPMNDLWIAAIALQHGLPILSNDVHFDHVPDINRLSF